MPVQPRLERIWASLGSPEPYQHLGLLSNVVPFSQAAELYRAGGVQHKRMRANYRSCIMLPAVFRTSLWVLDTDCLSALEAAWRHDTAQPQQCPDQAFPLQLHVVKGGVPSSVVAAVEEKMSHWPSSGISMGKVGTVGIQTSTRGAARMKCCGVEARLTPRRDPRSYGPPADELHAGATEKDASRLWAFTAGSRLEELRKALVV